MVQSHGCHRRQLDPEDYEFNEKDRSVALTEVGEAQWRTCSRSRCATRTDRKTLRPNRRVCMGYLEQALRAQLLFTRNKDYIVQSGQVIIVDEFTGRLMPGRRWSEGLHQAVEAKEGVKVKPENMTYATITLQNYFRKYDKLAGMTGTAVTEAEEFGYHLQAGRYRDPHQPGFRVSQADHKTDHPADQGRRRLHLFLLHQSG